MTEPIVEHRQVLNCNGTQFNFVKFNSSEQDHGYMMKSSTFGLLTKQKDISNNRFIYFRLLF